MLKALIIMALIIIISIIFIWNALKFGLVLIFAGIISTLAYRHFIHKTNKQ